MTSPKFHNHAEEIAAARRAAESDRTALSGKIYTPDMIARVEQWHDPDYSPRYADLRNGGNLPSLGCDLCRMAALFVVVLFLSLCAAVAGLAWWLL